MADKFFDAMFTASVIGGSSGPAPVIVSKNITANGTYSALDDQADGYNPVVVNVPNSYTSSDEGKVVSSGQLVAQTDYGTVTENGTYDTTTNNSITVNISQPPNFELIKTTCSPSMNYGFSSNWSAKTWNGLTSVRGTYIWTDGNDIYYSYNENQYVLDKNTSTWNAKTWNGYNAIDGYYIWTDGTDIYFSRGSSQYVLDKTTSTWLPKTWRGLTSFSGYCIWTDGTDIYCSYYNENQYVLDKATDTWQSKTWNGKNPNGVQIWTDGTDIYYSDSQNQYVLDKTTSIWSAKVWTGLTNFNGVGVWTDGTDIYYSNQYVLDKTTSTWLPKTWSGLTSFSGSYIWTDGTDIYYSYNENQYVLDKAPKRAPSAKPY